MKYISICHALVTATLLLSFHAAPAQWTQSNGPWGGSIHDLAAHGDTVFAGTGSGLFMSTNRGTNWSIVKNSLPDCAMVPALDIFGGTVYAASGFMVSRSTDWGTTWTNTNSHDDCINGHTALSAGNGVLFAGVADASAFRSTDNGETWVGAGLNVETALAFHITDHAVLTGAYEGIFRSYDNGADWVNVKSGASVWSFASNSRFIFAASDSGVLRSADTGTTWTRSTGPIDSAEILSIVTHDATIYAGVATSGIFRSTDDGTTWVKTGSELPGKVLSLAISGGNIYAGTNAHGVFLSTDNGDSWTSATNGIYNIYFRSLAVNGDTLYAGSHEDIHRSTDNGATWSQIKNARFDKPIRALAFKGTTILVSVDFGGIFRSTDNGETWAKANNGLTDTNFVSLLFLNNMLLAGTPGGVYVSTNSGADWSKKDLGAADQSISRFFTPDGNTVFAATPSGIFRSGDNGDTWIKADSGIRSPGVNIHSFTATDEAVFVATFYGIYRSENSGADWTNVLPGNFFDQLCSSGRKIFAAGYHGNLIVSTDNGAHWTNTEDSLYQTSHVYSIAANTTTLFAQTDGSGIWRRPVADIVAINKTGGKRAATGMNAFNVQTVGRSRTIYFSLAQPERVSIGIYNPAGRKVASIVNARIATGAHRYIWDAGNYPAGCYMVRVDDGSRAFVRSVPIVR